MLEIWNAHAVGESQVVRQHWSSLVVFSRAFVSHFSYVFGEPAARSVVFLMPRVTLRARVERWVSFGQLPGRIFSVLFLPGPFF